jgi:hypothetical protein
MADANLKSSSTFTERFMACESATRRTDYATRSFGFFSFVSS